MMEASLDDVKRYLPHRPPMLLVHRVHEVLDDGITCVGGVGEDSPFVVDGLAPSVLAIELAAQSAALALAVKAAGSGSADAPAEPAVGYLATLRDVRSHVPALPANAPLLVTVRCTRALSRLAMFEAEVVFQDDGAEVLKATLSVASA